MSIPPIDLCCWLILQVLFVYWMLFVTQSVSEACLFLVVIARENLGERVFHFHLAVEGTSHVSLGAKGPILLEESCCWRLLVVVSIIWKLGLPIVLKAQQSCWLLIHTPLFTEIMHNILVLFPAIGCIVHVLGGEWARAILDITSEDHLGSSKLALVSCVSKTWLVEV